MTNHSPKSDSEFMSVARTVAAAVRMTTSPNPWVGAVIVSSDGSILGTGATEPPGGRHAEIVALDQAGTGAIGATLYTTLEPCSHHGRTPPCVDAIVSAGIDRVVVGIPDPDPNVSGQGLADLRSRGLAVDCGVDADLVTHQLLPYLHHRRTGRPYVVAKIAASLDGGTAAADGSSQWITGEASRADGHRLRAESQAIIVGAGTVRIDDPSLTVRHIDGPDPARIVIGSAPAGAKIHPCTEWDGPLSDLLDRLGEDGALQVLIEGGATVLRSFLDADLIDRFEVYLAPAIFAGSDAHPFIGGATAPSMDSLWRGQFLAVEHLGGDLRISLAPTKGTPDDQ